MIDSIFPGTGHMQKILWLDANQFAKAGTDNTKYTASSLPEVGMPAYVSM